MGIKLSDYINADNVKLENKDIKKLILNLQERGITMKTNEFIKQVESLGLHVEDCAYELVITRDSDIKVVAAILKYSLYNVDINRLYFENFPTNKRKELFNLLVEYTSTPIEDRKEEKKYYLNLKYNMDYVNLNHIDDDVYFDSKNNSIEHIQTVFTDKEIKGLPIWVNEMIEQGHIIKEEA